MLSKATLLSWLATVVAGSLVFGAMEHSSMNDVFGFGMLSMLVSAILGSPTLVVILIVINAFLKPEMTLRRRLSVVHSAHVVCAALTFIGLTFWDPGEDLILIASCYIPVAAIVWAIADWRLSRSSKPVMQAQGSQS